MATRYKVKKSRTTGTWWVLDTTKPLMSFTRLVSWEHTWQDAVRHAIYLNTNGGSTP